MRAANALSADESDGRRARRVRRRCGRPFKRCDFENAAAEDDDDDENMESYALQLDDFKGNTETSATEGAPGTGVDGVLDVLPSICTRSRKGDEETLKSTGRVVTPHAVTRTNRIALKDIFVTRENYKRLGFEDKEIYSLPPMPRSENTDETKGVVKLVREKTKRVARCVF